MTENRLTRILDCGHEFISTNAPAPGDYLLCLRCDKYVFYKEKQISEKAKRRNAKAGEDSWTYKCQVCGVEETKATRDVIRWSYKNHRKRGCPDSIIRLWHGAIEYHFDGSRWTVEKSKFPEGMYCQEPGCGWFVDAKADRRHHNFRAKIHCAQYGHREFRKTNTYGTRVEVFPAQFRVLLELNKWKQPVAPVMNADQMKEQLANVGRKQYDTA